MFLFHITQMKQVTEQPFESASFHDVVFNRKSQIAKVFQMLLGGFEVFYLRLPVVLNKILFNLALVTGPCRWLL